MSTERTIKPSQYDNAVPFPVPPELAAHAKATGQKVAYLVIVGTTDEQDEGTTVCFPEVPREKDIISIEWGNRRDFAQVTETCWRIMDVEGVRTAMPMVFASIAPEVEVPGVGQVSMPEGIASLQ